MAALWALWAVFAGWVVRVAGDTPETGLLAFRWGGGWAVVIPAAYLIAFAAVLVGTAWWLRTPPGYLTGSAADGPTGTTTGGLLYPVTRTQSADTARPGIDARTSTVSPGNTVT